MLVLTQSNHLLARAAVLVGVARLRVHAHVDVIEFGLASVLKALATLLNFYFYFILFGSKNLQKKKRWARREEGERRSNLR